MPNVKWFQVEVVSMLLSFERQVIALDIVLGSGQVTAMAIAHVRHQLPRSCYPNPLIYY